MKPYMWQFVAERDKALFAVVEAMVDKFPQNVVLWNDKRGRPIELSCHIFARAFAALFSELECVDGYFFKRFEHSWLVTQDYGLIDPYPVGMAGGPILMHDHPTSYTRPALLYTPDKRAMPKVYARIGFDEFARAVAHATDLLRAARA